MSILIVLEFFSKSWNDKQKKANGSYESGLARVILRAETNGQNGQFPK